MSMRTGHAPVIPDVLQDPIRDKGTAFTQAERDALGLTGRLPSAVLTLDQQAQRAYQHMQRQRDDLAKNVYMEQLHDRNEVVYGPAPLENRIRLVICRSSARQAARVYSLISPPRTGFRRIRSPSTSVMVSRGASGSSSGTRWDMPWCGRAVL